jgi:hypothetical protein
LPHQFALHRLKASFSITGKRKMKRRTLFNKDSSVKEISATHYITENYFNETIIMDIKKNALFAKTA